MTGPGGFEETDDLMVSHCRILFLITRSRGGNLSPRVLPGRHARVSGSTCGPARMTPGARVRPTHPYRSQPLRALIRGRWGLWVRPIVCVETIQC